MDKYSIYARIFPMLILFLPLIIIGLAYSVKYEDYYQILSTLGITAALSYFLSNISRDFGKKKEKLLWASWGGAPTSQLLDYGNDIIDSVTKDRYHEKMMQLSPVDQTIDFRNARSEDLIEIYRSWTKYLKTMTRDTKKYYLLFKENVSYGFRRNLWGLKPFSLFLIIICILSNYLFQFLDDDFNNIFPLSLNFIISELLLITLLLVWIFIINKDWIKIPAFAYAERLLESIDLIKI